MFFTSLTALPFRRLIQASMTLLGFERTIYSKEKNVSTKLLYEPLQFNKISKATETSDLIKTRRSCKFTYSHNKQITYVPSFAWKFFLTPYKMMSSTSQIHLMTVILKRPFCSKTENRSFLKYQFVSNKNVEWANW